MRRMPLVFPKLYAIMDAALLKTTELAWFYMRDIVRLHRMPESIVSDCNLKFTAKFWHELHRIMGTKLMMSTSFYPQMDGHSE